VHPISLKCVISNMASNVAFAVTSQWNYVIKSLKQSFGSRMFVEKEGIVSKGRPTPLLKEFKSKASGGFNGLFSQSWYTEYSWLCGRVEMLKHFCWPCLFFFSWKNVWSRDGLKNVERFRTLRPRHERSQRQISSLVSFLF
jgi:hypothetical protein